jgi:hypothetical protein
MARSGDVLVISYFVEPEFTDRKEVIDSFRSVLKRFREEVFLNQRVRIQLVHPIAGFSGEYVSFKVQRVID